MALRQTSSPVPVISKKQFEKEEKKLIKEIQLTTEETNELRDHLSYVTEASMNKKYTLLQNCGVSLGSAMPPSSYAFKGVGSRKLYHENIPGPHFMPLNPN